MDRPTTPAPNIIELALQYGASSYRNRSDTAHPAYGFTERGLLQFAESLVARAHPRIAALHTIAQYPATESLLNMDAANMRKLATDAVAGLKSDRTEHPAATTTDDADKALADVIKERDDAEEFGDKLLDLVLGNDRPEWSSAYGTDDALLQVEEKLVALERAQAGTSSTLASDISGAGAAALDAYLTICRTNAIVPDVGGAWASAFRAGADYAAQAMATQAGPATWDLIEQLVQLECSRERLHLEYMGKAMPADVYLRFQKLRDERIPALQSQLRAALAATPAHPATEDSSAGNQLAALIEGMSVSVDVSTGDHDAGHRYFGTVTEVMEDAGEKHGVTLLVQDAKPNFEHPQAKVQAEPVAMSAVQRETVAKLLELARIVDRAVEDWGESQEDGSSNVIFHQEEADALGVILDFLDGLPENPDPMILEGGTLKAARLLAEPQVQPADALSQAALDVLAERARQIEHEGYEPEADDAYEDAQLAAAAATYALLATGADGWRVDDHWPWSELSLKKGEPRRMLEKAGALILAEMERLDRATQKGGAA